MNQMNNPLLEEAKNQSLLTEELITMVKVIEAMCKRGAVEPQELTTLGKLHDKLQWQLKKIKNAMEQAEKDKEKDNAGLSKTDN